MEERQYKLLDGKAVSAQMKLEMAEEVDRIKALGGKFRIWPLFWSAMTEGVRHMLPVR